MENREERREQIRLPFLARIEGRWEAGVNIGNPFLLGSLPLFAGCVATNEAASGLTGGGADVVALIQGTHLTMTATFLTTLLLSVLFRQRVRSCLGTVITLLLVGVLGPPTLIQRQILLAELSKPVVILYPPLPVDSATYRRDSLQLVDVATRGWSPFDSLQFDFEIVQQIWVERILYKPDGNRILALVVMEKRFPRPQEPAGYVLDYDVKTLVADRIIGNVLDARFSHGGGRGGGGDTRAEATQSVLRGYFGQFDFYGNTGKPSVWDAPYLFAHETQFEFQRKALLKEGDWWRERRRRDSLARIKAGEGEAGRTQR